jgi:hypothetical protein
MTHNQLAAFVGRRGYLRVSPALAVIVRVTDARTAYGSTQLEIEPVQGQGRAWVDAGRLTFSQAAQG